MCEPMTIAAVGMSVLSAGLQYSAQQSASDNTRQAALVSAADQDKQLTLRELQEQDATGQKLHSQNIQEAEQSANVASTFAANGTSGISLDALVNHVHGTAEANRATLNQNYGNTVEQLQQNKQGVNDQALGRINAAPPPSTLGLLTNIAGSGLSGLAKYNNANPSPAAGGVDLSAQKAGLNEFFTGGN